MLQVIDNGVVVTLNGKANNDTLFWLSLTLGLVAIGVALTLMFLPKDIALLSLGGLVVVCCIFNYYRHHKTSSGVINTGRITVRAGMLIYDNGVRDERVLVLSDDKIQKGNGNIIIYDKQHNKKCAVTGFDNTKEVDVVVKVLQGQNLDKRLATISMSSS